MRPRTEISSQRGSPGLDVVQVTGTAGTGELEAAAVFVFIGAETNTGWLGDYVALDRSGFVLTGNELRPAGGPR